MAMWIKRAASAACVAVGLGLMAPAPALAKPGDIACIWSKLPDDLTGAVVAAQIRGDDNPFTLLSDRFEALQAAAQGCSVTLDKSTGRAIGAFVNQRASGANLSTKYGVQERRLAAAWAAMPAADRKRFADAYVDLEGPDKDEDFVTDVMNRMSDALGIKDDKGRAELFQYLLSTVRLELWESRF